MLTQADIGRPLWHVVGHRNGEPAGILESVRHKAAAIILARRMALEVEGYALLTVEQDNQPPELRLVPAHLPPLPQGARLVNGQLPRWLVILRALVAREGGCPWFTRGDIVVASWRQCPEQFGLCGYRDLYPDANRVLCLLDGDRGLAKRGLLRRAATDRYEITPEGRKAAEVHHA